MELKHIFKHSHLLIYHTELLVFQKLCSNGRDILIHNIFQLIEIRRKFLNIFDHVRTLKLSSWSIKIIRYFTTTTTTIIIVDK